MSRNQSCLISCIQLESDGGLSAKLARSAPAPSYALEFPGRWDPLFSEAVVPQRPLECWVT